MDFFIILSFLCFLALIFDLISNIVDLFVKPSKFEKKYNELIKLYDFTLIRNGLTKEKELLKYLKYINRLNKEEYEQLKLEELKEEIFE